MSAALLGAPPAARAGGAPADSAESYPAAQVKAWQLGLARPDRLQHASLSFTLAAGATLAGRRPAAAFTGVLLVGALKELWDARSTFFDPVDLAADGLGAALGASAAGGVR